MCRSGCQSACICEDCGKSCEEESEGLVEGDEGGEVTRTQSLMGLQCHAEDLGFCSEGNGESWRGFEQRRGRVRFEY